MAYLPKDNDNDKYKYKDKDKDIKRTHKKTHHVCGYRGEEEKDPGQPHISTKTFFTKTFSLQDIFTPLDIFSLAYVKCH